jgi:hypothetical protein
MSVSEDNMPTSSGVLTPSQFTTHQITCVCLVFGTACTLLLTYCIRLMCRHCDCVLLA